MSLQFDFKFSEIIEIKTTCKKQTNFSTEPFVSLELTVFYSVDSSWHSYIKSYTNKKSNLLQKY